MDLADEPVIFLGKGYDPLDDHVPSFCCRVEIGANRGVIHVALGLELFLTSIVLRRPDIRKIHVFYESDSALYREPSKVFQIASNSMKYSGISLLGHPKHNFEMAKKFARDRRAATTAAGTVKEAIVVDDSKRT